MDGTNPAPACAHCSNLAVHACSVCNNAPAYEIPSKNTYYCSTQCQKDDWLTHKAVCKTLKTRKMLFRAGELLQEIFYVYREQVFDKVFVKVEKRDGKMLLHQGEYPPLSKMSNALDLLFPFDPSVVSDPLDKASILTYMACGDAVAWMHDLVKYVLPDLCSKFKEMRVMIQNRERHLVMVTEGEEHSSDQPHCILKVKLKNSDEWYIVDLAGAQYGFFEPIVPAVMYEKSYVRSHIDSHGAEYFGQGKEVLIQFSQMPVLAGNSCKLNHVISEYLMKGVEDWEAEHASTIQGLLGLKEKEFQERRAGLIANVEKWVSSCVKVVKQQGEVIRAKMAAGAIDDKDLVAGGIAIGMDDLKGGGLNAEDVEAFVKAFETRMSDFQ
ncbi:hypothetical protein LSUE1_G007415 [Lachnellula suecica]|uniref:MYND-type domain-containing protein n=1 Tax=Lachnellula suecica TaxID=602035 RepID=A0A8T9C555_9HELO|nr:hypothetical protein LSUE1_G007415 [Lachnellula suecica]